MIFIQTRLGRCATIRVAQLFRENSLQGDYPLRLSSWSVQLDRRLTIAWLKIHFDIPAFSTPRMCLEFSHTLLVVEESSFGEYTVVFQRPEELYQRISFTFLVLA